ncbi:LRR receptor-like serine/threonine-protein kinase FLS2 [Panicum miliaceum]|uniref:LRR receptor-like serine/threonine-protein kinase FLS2 n=1 Tax=Panicum miliaceum TaxID=4540 RepID=A0A3L6RNM6_PANMI|nr:LRR receptor-like serine/threonine-protein kinase FLS2 [Panicum miliaceum]
MPLPHAECPPLAVPDPTEHLPSARRRRASLPDFGPPKLAGEVKRKKMGANWSKYFEKHDQRPTLCPRGRFANSTCSWSGVTCDGAGHVTALRLPGAGINGKLDAFYLTAFQNLTRLDLSSNNLGGTIPVNLSMLFTLTSLDLSNNSLTGAIPYQLSQLPGIAKLNLGNNHLTNPEYGKFSPMPGLKSLSLANNDLNGTFPWFVLNCTSR